MLFLTPPQQRQIGQWLAATSFSIHWHQSDTNLLLLLNFGATFPLNISPKMSIISITPGTSWKFNWSEATFYFKPHISRSPIASVVIKESPTFSVQTFSTETHGQTAKHSTPSAPMVLLLDESPTLAHVLMDRAVPGRGGDGQVEYLAGQTTAITLSISCLWMCNGERYFCLTFLCRNRMTWELKGSNWREVRGSEWLNRKHMFVFPFFFLDILPQLDVWKWQY